LGFGPRSVNRGSGQTFLPLSSSHPQQANSAIPCEFDKRHISANRPSYALGWEMNNTQSQTLSENLILSALPDKQRNRLLPDLEPYPLPLSKIIYEIGDRISHIYFPGRAVVSLVSYTEQGEGLEVGLVGHEGMVGLPVFFEEDVSEYRNVVQVSNGSLRMKVDAFKAAVREMDSLRDILLRYSKAVMTHLAQSAICNRFHPIEQRLSRWLLLCSDAAKSNELDLTQEFLANMLGTHRPAVTVVARTLQTAGLSTYGRGHISVVDRQGLEAASCECYGVVSQALQSTFKHIAR
jgi:CRP-like cAMP-binding protein